MKIIKKLSLLLLLILPLTVKAESNFPDFTKIVKESVSAVVSVNVEISTPQQGENLDEFVNEELFNRFFGIPQEQKHPRQRPETISAHGSGFLVSKDGYIMTNNHIVNDSIKVSVKLYNGREYDATVVGKDPSTDLAIIKIEEDDLDFLSLGNSDTLEIGEWVIAIGNPLGLQTSVSAGIVSAKNRGGLHIASYENFIQTDAAINQGNSGGPLLNVDGKVIGINSALATNTGGYMGIGFAIPSTMANKVMQQIIDNGSVNHGFLGVEMQEITNDLAEAFELEKIEGSLITNVLKASPAEKAKLKQGDIILEYNDKTVLTPHTIRNAIAMMEPGSELDLKIKRKNKIINIKATVGAHPNNTGDDKDDISHSIGIEVEDMTPELSQQLGYSEKGVLIMSVRPNSPAAKMGLRKGTLIISINHKKVSSVDEMKQNLEKNKDDGKVLLFVKQGPVARYVPIKLT